MTGVVQAEDDLQQRVAEDGMDDKELEIQAQESVLTGLQDSIAGKRTALKNIQARLREAEVAVQESAAQNCQLAALQVCSSFDPCKEQAESQGRSEPDLGMSQRIYVLGLLRHFVTPVHLA